ncbi:MAG: single-stranded DNA-binding protein [Anaerolineales bacterium]|nr:single-stranded DNA-binding protein [Anaerolineales bacterium]
MFQKIILVGNLGRDPEMRYTPSGQAVCNLNIATNRTWSRDGEQQKETAWFRVTVWGRQAETVHQYLRKGRTVLVEGRLNPDENGNPRVWTGNDGQARASFEVTAQTVRFLGGRGEASDFDNGDAFPAGGPQSEDEIPF